MFNNLTPKTNQEIDDIFADTDVAPAAPVAGTPPPAGNSLPKPISLGTMPSKAAVPLSPAMAKVPNFPMPADEKSSAGKVFKILIGAIVALLIIGAGAYFIYAKFLVGNYSNNQIATTTGNVSAANTPATTTVPVMNITGNENPTSTGAINTNATPTAPVIPGVNAPAASSTATAVADTDKDGLNDAEEALFGTNPDKTDTDGDGYSDYAEVTGAYNPTGAGNIQADAQVQKYFNKSYNYSFYAPKNLKFELTDQNSSMVLIAADNSFFQIVAQPNADKVGIVAWFTDKFKQTPPAVNLIKVDGYDAIKSADGLIVYTADKNNFYIISYSPATDNVLTYKEIFGLILKTFTIAK